MSSTFGLPVSDRYFLPPRASISRRNVVIQLSISSAPSNTIRRFEVCFLSWPRNGRRENKEEDGVGGVRSGSATEHTCNTQCRPGITSLAKAAESFPRCKIFSGRRSNDPDPVYWRRYPDVTSTNTLVVHSSL